MTERLPTSLPEVTPRQREVARLVAEGLTNEEIAARLQISLAGAKYHVSELLGRLGAERREEIADWYRRGGAERPRPWLRWQRALVALAAGALGATAIVAMAVGVPSGGGGEVPWPEGNGNTEVVTRAHLERVFMGLSDGGVLHRSTENYYRDGRLFRTPEGHSFTLPERYVSHLWEIYDSDGTLQRKVGATIGEDGLTYERSFGSQVERVNARELPTVGYLHAAYWDGPSSNVRPLDVLRGLDETSAHLRTAVASGESEARLHKGRLTVVSRDPSYPCGRVIFPVDLFPLRTGVREERDVEAATYLSIRSACWVDLQDGSEVLLASTSTTFEALDASEWDAIVDQVWPDGIPTPTPR